MLNRRNFLRSLGAASAMSFASFHEDGLERVSAAAHATSEAAPEAIAGDEDFWREVQQAFTVDRSLINLNNGGVSPSPRIVQEAMRRYLDYSNQAPTVNMWKVLEPQVEGIRRRLATAFGCDPEEIAITRNASEAMEICIFGLDLKAGDEALSTDQDFPRMLNAFRQREKREGIKLKTISVPVAPSSIDDLYHCFEQAITSRTKVILICHMTYRNGQIFPIKRICRLGRERGIEVIVDGAHSFAHFPFKQADLDCDYYGTSLHKWLLAPHGTGFLYVKKSKIKELWPLMAAAPSKSEDIRKFEDIGTHPAANHNAIAEALTFHEGIGAERKAARLRYLRDRWAKRLKNQKGVSILTSLSPEQSCGLATIGIEGIESKKLAKRLWEQYRIIVLAVDHPRIRGIRVTPNVYTTLEEIDTFCEAMEKVIRSGLPPN